MFRVDVTFEIRTVLSGIHLFNDNHPIVRSQFYMKWKWREREWNSGETERESVCERLRMVETER